jgi:VWFA-related protein
MSCSVLDVLLNAAIATVLLLPLPLASQQGSMPVLRVHSDLVVLDTSVVDAKGNPVTGLHRDDFAIYVDGQPKPIAAFDTVEERPLPETARSANAVLDVRRPATFGATPLTIFVLDEVNTHFTDTSYAKRSLEAYMEKQPRVLPQAAALFVLTDGGLRLEQAFTADRDLMLEALKKTRIENAWNLENSKSVGEGVADRLAVSLTSLEQIAHSVRAIPVHKTLIWLGAGFPSVDPTTLTPSVKKMLDGDMEYVTNILLDARISLDAVDPTSMAAGMTEVTDASQLAFLAAAGDSSSTLSDPFDKSFDFDRLAPVSGGRVLRGRNDVGALVDAAARAGAAYYSLGYVPEHTGDAAPKYHKIEVRLKRRDLTVLSRQGYYSGVSESALKTRERMQADLNDAVATAIPMTDLQMSAVGENGHYKVSVASARLNWKQEADGKLGASVQIVAAALSNKGVVLNHKLQQETAHAAVDAEPEIHPREVVFPIDLNVPAGATMVRFVVRDAATGKMGTFDLTPKH